MTKELYSGAEIILKSLVKEGVKEIFGYPGGQVITIYEALYNQNEIKHYLVRHEQAAIHAAEGYSRATGKCGVALVTSGPGACNTITTGRAFSNRKRRFSGSGYCRYYALLL